MCAGVFQSEYTRVFPGATGFELGWVGGAAAGSVPAGGLVSGRLAGSSSLPQHTHRCVPLCSLLSAFASVSRTNCLSFAHLTYTRPDRFGFPRMICLGAAVVAVALWSASFARELSSLYFTQGVLVGVGWCARSSWRALGVCVIVAPLRLARPVSHCASTRTYWTRTDSI